MQMEKAGEKKNRKSIEERTKREMTNKTKGRTIIDRRWVGEKEILIGMWQWNNKGCD